MRTCTKCQQDKPVTAFGTGKNGQGRVFTYKVCRPCCAARSAQQRAAERAKWSISGEITALIRATTARSQTTPPPVPTREELAVWHQAGCPIAPHQRRQVAA